jgi:signal transduction histidine kinase
LQATAQRWADGSLHERADPLIGPPEVREVATALNVMAQRLDTLVHGSRAVVADVSHQLRTPLAAMRLRLELLRDEVARAQPGANVDEDVTVSLGEVERLSRLVDGLLAVARAEGTTAESEPVDVSAAVRERRHAWQPVAEERGVQIDVDCDGGATASVTAGHLEQILDNLLDNALEAMPSGGYVRMSVRSDGPHVTVVVTDTGVGMTPEQQQVAFRRFVSGRSDGGTGLGLAIVHRLVTADGGDVSLRSEPGAGTTVSIQLPAARADDLTRAGRRR